jgi:hypothetical protein
MQTFLDTREMNRQTINHQPSTINFMKHLQFAATLLLILFVFAICMVGLGVFGKLVWYLITWGWQTF